MNRARARAKEMLKCLANTKKRTGDSYAEGRVEC